MTTAAISTQPSVVDPAAAPGRVRLWLRDGLGFIPAALRLAWLHWPVLLALALGGTLVREVLIAYTPRYTGWGGGLGYLLLFPLLPVGLLTSMVLMLRVVRPSLRYLGERSRLEPMVRYLASVLLPFFAFYLAAYYADYDKSRFNYSIAAGIFYGYGDDKRYLQVTGGLLVVAIAVLSFGLRWLMLRFQVVRRLPLLALPALYVEVLWLYSAFIAGNDYTPRAWAWLKGSKAWRAGEDWWRSVFTGDTTSAHALGGLRYLLDQFFNAAFPVLLAPISALVAGSVVLAARITPRANARTLSTRDTVLRVGEEVGRSFAGRFGLLADALRRVAQAGVVPMMVFCFCYVCQRAIGPLLNEPERLIIGPRDPEKFWNVFDFNLQWVNDSIALVVLMCLVAAFVDGTAARIARRAAGPEPAPPSAPADIVQTPMQPALVQPILVPPGQSTPLPTRIPQGQQPPAGQGLWEREPNVPR